MTTEERKRAAEVMAAEGPWDVRGRGQGEDAWTPCQDPSWDWIRYDYRVRPPEPVPLPCPFCGATFWHVNTGWQSQHRDTCPLAGNYCIPDQNVHLWNKRQACAACSGMSAERNVARQDAQDWHKARDEMYAAGKEWEGRAMKAERDLSSCRTALAAARKDAEEWNLVAGGLHDKLKAAEGRLAECLGVVREAVQKHGCWWGDPGKLLKILEG